MVEVSAAPGNVAQRLNEPGILAIRKEARLYSTRLYIVDSTIPGTSLRSDESKAFHELSESRTSRNGLRRAEHGP